MALRLEVIGVSQQMMHTKNQTSRQPELPISPEKGLEVLPKEVIAQCRQLLGQMLREVLQAEKEAHDEH